MTGLAEIDGFKFFISSVYVAGLPTSVLITGSFRISLHIDLGKSEDLGMWWRAA